MNAVKWRRWGARGRSQAFAKTFAKKLVLRFFDYAALPGNRGGQLMRLMSVHRPRPGTDREGKTRDRKIFCLETGDEVEIDVWLASWNC
jgi:hypothetical protein